MVDPGFSGLDLLVGLGHFDDSVCHSLARRSVLLGFVPRLRIELVFRSEHPLRMFDEPSVDCIL